MIFDQEKETIRRLSSTGCTIRRLSKIQASVRHFDDGQAESLTYWNLIQNNRPFRFYLLSYFLDHLGEWFTYVAAISLIEEFNKGASAKTAVSILVIVRILPHVLFSTVGGTIADSRDKRIFMIQSGMLGSLIALCYLLCYTFQSTYAVYVVMFLQQLNSALYEPNRSSIVPLMVTDGEALKKATTLSVLAWSVIAALGAGLGGFAVAAFGTKVCFMIDSLTYLASALSMWMVGGDWKSADEATEKYDCALDCLCGMVAEGFLYLSNSFFGPLVLLKATTAVVYGATDVLNVAFSERGEGESSIKLGLLFAVAGVGCIIGPMVAERFTNISRLSTLQLVAIVSMSIGNIGCIGMGLVYPFWNICLFTGVRSAGNAALWINSTLMLQTLTSPEKLGRVLAIDYALALFAEAISAVACGVLLDTYAFEPEQVSLLVGTIGLCLTFAWGVYHWNGNGCARSDLEALMKSRTSPKKMAPDESTALLIV